MFYLVELVVKAYVAVLKWALGGELAKFRDKAVTEVASRYRPFWQPEALSQ